MRYSYLVVREEKWENDIIFGVCTSPAKAKEAIAKLKEEKPQYKGYWFTIRKVPQNIVSYEPWK